MPILPKKAVQELTRYVTPADGRLNYVRLDCNENTKGFPACYPADIPHQQVSAYPEYEQLTARLAKFFGVPPECILLTNGSDEGLMVIALTFIEPAQDTALVCDPCFTMIPHGLKLAGAALKVVPAKKDLLFNIQGIEKALYQGVRLAMFASPDNPTGAVLPEQAVLQWCRRFPKTLFVIDEAYSDYHGSSLVQATGQFDNLLITRTFSKAWGMAGLRLGVVVGCPDLIEYMMRVRLPYSVNSAAVWTAGRLLDNWQAVADGARQAMSAKQDLVTQLAELGYRVDDGRSNSVLVHAGINAQRFSEVCKSEGVLVRNRSAAQFPESLNGQRPPLWGKVRVSVGTPEEHQRFLGAVRKFNDGYGIIFDLDGTLIDTSESFDRTVRELVERHSGAPLPAQELEALRAEGGYNDDWLATHELLKRRGKNLALASVVAEASTLYLSVARKAERLLFTQELFDRLRTRHPLFVVTGRTRGEYEPVWADDLNGHFHHVYCLDDIPGKKGKPSPDYLLHLIDQFGLHGGVYVGNTVDDMQAARQAGLDAIAVTTTHGPDVLRQAGAHIVIPSVEALAEVFMV